MNNQYHCDDLTRMRQLLFTPEHEIRGGDLWRGFGLTPTEAHRLIA